MANTTYSSQIIEGFFFSYFTDHFDHFRFIQMLHRLLKLSQLVRFLLAAQGGTPSLHLCHPATCVMWLHAGGVKELIGPARVATLWK